VLKWPKTWADAEPDFHDPYGPRVVITSGDVRLARKNTEGFTITQRAEMLGVSRATVRRAINGETWRQLK
jgi:predicted transcriptional regulator